MSYNTNQIYHLKIKRTYRYLTESFIELMKEKSLEEISVVEICDKALVHRTTFYKHFEDKYHLLDYMIDEVRNNIEKTLSNEKYEGDLNVYIKRMVNSLFKLIDEDKNLQYVLFAQYKSKFMKNLLHELIVNDIQRILKEHEKCNTQMNLCIEITSQIIAGGIISVIGWWYKEGLKTPREDIMENIQYVFSHILD